MVEFFGQKPKKTLSDIFYCAVFFHMSQAPSLYKSAT